jgi:hypothetical protein
MAMIERVISVANQLPMDAGLLWAKVAGHPFWPSRACTAQEEATMANLEHEEDDICVYFLGANNL